MPLLSVALAVALMLALVAWVKLDAFLALLLTAFAVGLVNGLGALGTLQSILRGLGATLGGVTLVLVFGAMLGALVDSSGAARVITQRLVARFGVRRVQLAMVLTGFLVGLPMLYNAGFLLLIPLVYTVAAQTGLSIVWVGVPLAAALSVTHGFLPPHPAPTSSTRSSARSTARSMARSPNGRSCASVRSWSATQRGPASSFQYLTCSELGLVESAMRMAIMLSSGPRRRQGAGRARRARERGATRGS